MPSPRPDVIDWAVRRIAYRDAADVNLNAWPPPKSFKPGAMLVLRTWLKLPFLIPDRRIGREFNLLERRLRSTGSPVTS